MRSLITDFREGPEGAFSFDMAPTAPLENTFFGTHANNNYTSQSVTPNRLMKTWNASMNKIRSAVSVSEDPDQTAHAQSDQGVRCPHMPRKAHFHMERLNRNLPY